VSASGIIDTAPTRDLVLLSQGSSTYNPAALKVVKLLELTTDKEMPTVGQYSCDHIIPVG